MLRRDYNMTLSQVMAMLEAQHNRCAACDLPFEKNKVALRHGRPVLVRHEHIDHEHGKRGAVRGILCRTCNMVAGMLGDTADEVEQRACRLIDYLRNFELIAQNCKHGSWVGLPGNRCETCFKVETK